VTHRPALGAVLPVLVPAPRFARLLSAPAGIRIAGDMQAPAWIGRITNG
jgi:hypothetical protein